MLLISIWMLLAHSEDHSNITLWDKKNNNFYSSSIKDPMTTVLVSGWVFVLIWTVFVGFRWNENYKKDLFSSRIDTTKALAQAIAASSSPPQSWVLVSGVGKSWCLNETFTASYQIPLYKEGTSMLLFCHFDLQPVISPVRLLSIQRTVNGHRLTFSPNL